MKALTLTQPWATLVAIGAKRIETRSWPTKYRGPVAIHAAKTFPGWAKDCAQNSEAFRRALGWPEPVHPLTQEWINAIAAGLLGLPLGAVIATARIVNCLDTDLIPRFVSPFTEQERAFGDYSAGRYGFILGDVRMLPEPISAKGALGLWEWKPPAGFAEGR